MRGHDDPTLRHPMCVGCGTQYAACCVPLESCAICTDDRQFVNLDGQQWTTHEELASRHRARVEIDGCYLGIGIDGQFAIPQRSLLVPTTQGSIMWDCTSLVTDEAIREIDARGGVALIAISHPHFYAAMVEWSEALGGVPILLHRRDSSWVMRDSPHIEFWDGDRLDLFDGASLVHLPGHFPGSAALHHVDPITGMRSLLAGDSLHVAQDRRHISVMHSVPNFIPVAPSVVRGIQERLAGIEFDDLYGFTWGLNITGAARAAVDRSLERYLEFVRDAEIAA